MSTFLIARRDLSFLLYEWLRIEELAARARYADHSRETFDAALDAYHRIAERKFAPHYRLSDEHEPRFQDARVVLPDEVGEAVRAFCETGLIAAGFDAEHGGMQLPHAVERAGMALVFAANVASAAYPFLTIAAAGVLLKHADAALAQRFLPELLSGRCLGTMCLSEPHAGSSLADIATRAVRQSDGRYRLFGAKMWISAGEHEISGNILHLVLAKATAPGQREAAAGVKGISLFAAPKHLDDDGVGRGQRNDIVLAGLNHKMGYRGASNCLLNFGEGSHLPDGQPGALAWLIAQEGEGLACMFHMMNEARIGVGVGAAALGYRGYLHSVDYARTRVQGRPPGERDPSLPPTPIIEHADVRRMLLAQKSYVEGAMALALFSARLLDDQRTSPNEQERGRAGRLLDLLTPVTKAWPSQWCLAANDLAIQVHGGYGYTRDFPLEQLYRDNRLNPIHEGTNGIQGKDLLGRKVAQHGGAATKDLAERIATSIRRAQSNDLSGLARNLAHHWRRLQEATAALLQLHDAELRLANSTPYLDAFGHVIVAWLWLEQALVAEAALGAARNTEDVAFYRGKLQACRYFFNWELPKVAAWLALLNPVDRSCLDMRNEWF